MGHNTKLAGHHVQLRITLTRLTSDYRGEQPYCSTQGEPKRRVHLSTCQLPPRFSLSPRFLSSSYFRVRAVHLSIYSSDLMCITRDRIRHNAFENHYFPSRNPTQISFSICIHVATTALFPALQRALLRNRIRRCLHASILLTIAYGRYACTQGRFASCLAMRIRFIGALHCSSVDRFCIRSVHRFFRDISLQT